jgi:heptosyltransferase-2
MNILIIKTGALGDVVRSSFVAQALKDKYSSKKTKIYWITSKLAKSFFLNNLYVDKVFIEEEKNKLKEIQFDVVVNLEEDEENAKFTSLLKPKIIYGFYWKKGIVPSTSAKYWFDMSILGKKPENDILKKKNKKTHRQILCDIIEVKNYEKYEPFLKLTSRQRIFAESFKKRYNLSKGNLIFGINTGSADRWPKQLSIEKTAELIDLIYQKHQAKIILFGGENEYERNQKILSLSHSPVIDAGCNNSLEDFYSLISLCDFFITADTLGLHLALALKRKIICLVGPTSSSEIDMYKRGEKVIAKSNCLCCYKKNCDSMNKIDILEILSKIDLLLKQKIVFLITAYKEPKTIGKAIESALNQETKYPYEIVLCAPDKETLDVAKKYPSIKTFKDSGKGKSFALNSILSKLDADILILSDGDVFVNDKSVESLVSQFNNLFVGCVTGKPVPQENKKTKWGYWANFLFDSAHKLRKKSFLKNSFIECSGYLFAYRKKIIPEIPLDVAEDTFIPYYFWEKGYSIGYAEEAKVYVKNVNNYLDWINQKVRCAKAHEPLEKYVNVKITKRVKSFSTESKGFFSAIFYAKNFKEFSWSIELVLLRLYMWIKVIIETKFKKKNYLDNWKRVESTK